MPSSSNNPFHGRNEKLKATQREFRLQVACVAHLRSAFPGLFFFHVPNRGGDATDGHFKKMMGAVAGAPDLVLTWNNEKGLQVAAIELKAPEGNISSPQNKFLSAIDHIGWKTAICRSVDELHHTLHGWGLIPLHDGIREPDYRNENDKFSDVFEMYKP